MVKRPRNCLVPTLGGPTSELAFVDNACSRVGGNGSLKRRVWCVVCVFTVE